MEQMILGINRVFKAKFFLFGVLFAFNVRIYSAEVVLPKVWVLGIRGSYEFLLSCIRLEHWRNDRTV